MRAPDTKATDIFNKLTLHYQLSTGEVKTIDIKPPSEDERLLLFALSHEDDFRDTQLYPIIAAVNGGTFCDEMAFYRFLYNDLMKVSDDTGNVFNSSGSYISRTNKTTYPQKPFCGIDIAYEFGSFETASFDYYSAGRLERLTLKPRLK